MASPWDITELITMVLTVPETIPEKRVLMFYLGNIPFDVDLCNDTQMGYSITGVPKDNNAFAYIIRVAFVDQFVVKEVSLF